MANPRGRKIGRAEFDKHFWNLSQETRNLLWEAYEARHEENEAIDEYSYQCSMCGKDMTYSKTGRCPHCEQVWNS